ncbi:MAG TPA: NAD-dependent malic enzyme [Bdellovibrionota bacterium]|nr:NAD-dependent malic enzyme [Bdellovibrionota bacterium]
MSSSKHRSLDEHTLRVAYTGDELLHDPGLNKGTAFTADERRRLGLEGLLPPRICSQDEQVARVLENYRKKPNELEKFIHMGGLQDRNETLFYRVIQDHIEEMMPVIYTPVVGKACQLYGHIFRRSRGMFLTRHERSRFRQVLKNWPEKDVRVIVVTDGERILGLGDLGANGMGIPVGKLALYTACAGVHPRQSLPITLDVGTNNQELLKDPLYLGTQAPRLKGKEYDDLIEEFVSAVQDIFPKALLQFEDFANHNAFRLLNKYRERVCCFNDDIQGTAAVTVAGIYSAMKITQKKLTDQTILMHGAGEAAIGIGDLIVSAIMEGGLAKPEAISRCWFVDSKGLVESSRKDLQEHKRPYAHSHAPMADLFQAVRSLRPTALVGVSGHPKQFTKEILEEMAKLNERPVVFALSNPTSQAECTAEEAYVHTRGRAIFASGSPFDPVTYEGKRFAPGQGNNAYIFPGVGLGVVLSGARFVTDEMFFASAKTLAQHVSKEDLERGSIYPPLSKIREVSAAIAGAVMEIAHRRELAREPKPSDIPSFVQAKQYRPTYLNYV